MPPSLRGPRHLGCQDASAHWLPAYRRADAPTERFWAGCGIAAPAFGVRDRLAEVARSSRSSNTSP